MVWPFSQQPPQPEANPFAQQSIGQQPNGYMGHPQFQAQWGTQPQQPNPMMAGMMSGAGINSQYAQQPVAPPSELEIVAMLLQTSRPVDRWMAGPNLQLIISVFANLVNLSFVEFFRNAKFVEDKEGNLVIDIASLPSQYQTLSPENVTNDLTALQASCNQSLQQSIMEQQQLLTLSQQSMMQGALDAALSDPGLLERVGSGLGGLARGAAGMR